MPPGCGDACQKRFIGQADDPLQAAVRGAGQALPQLGLDGVGQRLGASSSVLPVNISPIKAKAAPTNWLKDAIYE